MRPIYQTGETAELQDDSHKGLWFERFFDYASDWSIGDTQKKNFLNKFKESCGDKHDLHSNAFRQIEMVEALGGESVILETTWNFVTGIGLPHPVENGLSWHPTLGVPFLSGSGVKGLLRAWVEEWMEFSNNNEKLPLLYCWFGSENKDPRERTELRKNESHPLHGNKNDTVAGDLIFFDAIPIEPVALTKDIITPHMGKWYEKGGEIANVSNEPEKVPADWHDPVPVPFLAVKKAKFLFSIVPSKRLVDKSEVKKALDALVTAIEFLGVGAKTAVGYGRMQKDGSAIETFKAEMRRKREELQRLKELETMTPLEKEIAEMIYTKSDKNMRDYILLFQKLESGHWSEPNVKKQVAEKIKTAMEKENEWREISNKSKKDKGHKRTLAVMKYLQ